MSSRVPVLLKHHTYEIIVGHGTLERAGEFVSRILSSPRCALITDENVANHYLEIVQGSLEAAGFDVTPISIPPGEASKSFAAAEQICETMAAEGLDRGSFVVALGGGVVGDLAGFVAAIYYRGIRCVQIPTTVMAQVDSSIGGKTGINLRAGKNLIGAFHQPLVVITDPGVLVTLPKREFNEGVAEMIKHAVIRDPEMLDELEAFSGADLSSLVGRNVQIKARIVAEDEYETLGIRSLLNFGHTIGHAVETVAGYGHYLHGEAISLGLVAALALSVKQAGLDPAAAERVTEILHSFELPTVLPGHIGTEEVMAVLKRDKKFEAGAIRFVLCDKLGSAFVSKDITEDDLRQAVEDLRHSPRFSAPSPERPEQSASSALPAA